MFDSGTEQGYLFRHEIAGANLNRISVTIPELRWFHDPETVATQQHPGTW